ncbi:MAG: hypothetical protein F6K42_26900 [Leptolyngbya sp. SIO1D8]|nr:hypothetical protein [Leptolyngbya sp. SIO1D8]
MMEGHSEGLSNILTESVNIKTNTSRRALCKKINFSHPTLELLNASDEDFSVILIDQLTATENETSLCKLCNILLREFKGSKKALLRQILKEYCIQEDNIGSEEIFVDDSIKSFLEAIKGRGCSKSEKVFETSLEQLFYSIEDELINNHRYWRYFKLSAREIKIEHVSEIYFIGLAEKTERVQKLSRSLAAAMEMS